MSFFNEAKQLIKQNIREYGMYIALVLIMAYFTWSTDGLFAGSRNISDLLKQTGYIAVLAVGMTLVIIIRHIDLSVGFVAGFIGAIVAILLTKHGVPVVAAIIIALLIGTIIGVINGFLVAKLNIPSFVVTLAGMMIFKGALQMATEGTGTIIIPNASFNAIGNGYIPDIVHIEGIHVLTLIIGAVGILLYIWSEINTRKNKMKYKFEVLSIGMFMIKLAFVSAIIAAITWILAGFRGISWTVVIVIVVVAIFHFITNKTALGRHIYAVGGNPDAAKLSGINVNKITYIVFAIMGMLAALAGILYTSRLQSASTTAGLGFELSAIAAAYVGGVSAAGGVGKVTASLIGALVIGSLNSGMLLMGVNDAYKNIIIGTVLVLAVIFDVTTRSKRK